ncbi:hypothetical protein QR98_0050940, partial [Sarcoptes scabiei]
IITQLNADILRNIKTCFTGLHNNVKLKLLLSFLHIAKRNVEEWSNELNNLIQIAENDSNPWVKAIAEFLLQYPQKGTINIDDSNFSEIIFYLKKCAFSSSFGQSSQPIKHFTLKRKAKSASLRAELLQKAEDLSSGKRPSTGTTVPIRCRGLNSSDSAPLRGIPSRIYSNSPFNKSLGRSFSSGFGSSNRSGRLSSVASSGAGMKRDGGIVLLDEAPSTNQRESKRQKKDKNLASAKTSNQKIDQESSKELTTDESREDQAEKVIDHNDKELADSQPDNNPTEDKKDFTGPNKHSISKSAPDYAAGLLAGVSTSNLSDSSYDNMNNFSSTQQFEQNMSHLQARQSFSNKSDQTSYFNSDIATNSYNKSREKPVQSSPNTHQPSGMPFSRLNDSSEPMPSQNNNFTSNQRPINAENRMKNDPMTFSSIHQQSSSQSTTQFNPSPTNMPVQENPIQRLTKPSVPSGSSVVNPPVQATRSHLSVDQLLRDINTKFPRLPENDKNEIFNFLHGGSNPKPETGSQRIIRLGETIELRQKQDGLPYRVIVETQLFMDYENKICKRMENIKALTELSSIRSINTVPATSNIVAKTVPSNPTQIQQNQPRNLMVLNTRVNNPSQLNVNTNVIRGTSINIQQMMAARPGMTFMTLTPSGQLQPIDPNMLSQGHLVSMQQNNNSSQTNKQQLQFSHLQQRV